MDAYFSAYSKNSKFPADSRPLLLALKVIRTILKIDQTFSSNDRCPSQGGVQGLLLVSLYTRVLHIDEGGQQRWLQKVKVGMSQVIQEPGTRKEASTSLIQHG